MDIRNFGTLRKRQSNLDVQNELSNEHFTVELNQILSTDASVQPKDSNLPQTSAAASVNLEPEFDLGTLEDGPARPVLNAYPIRNNRKFLKKWYDEYSWLEYSVNEDASYCFSEPEVLVAQILSSPYNLKKRRHLPWNRCTDCWTGIHSQD